MKYHKCVLRRRYVVIIQKNNIEERATRTHLSCIALEAFRWSLRTSKWTWRAYLVRYNASSVAVSPPPTTARTWPLNNGDAPSQIAQALIPLLQNSSSRGNWSLLAVAPVAKMTLWHLTWDVNMSEILTFTKIEPTRFLSITKNWVLTAYMHNI